ncbi:NAD-P-binding protein [Multifurca ochricompacta]|uniref:NAD-P-binding protein n=1 Tax=Multifurca ochricompacta TaxID=376703 RepID=A0AAD4M2C0_9AGAM|nr:NAD-P-binding protein [Multifurca ochricompacta]
MVLPSIIVGLDETLPGVPSHHDVYSTIDPQIHFSEGTYRDKVVLITGASRGIGAETARYYARAGAVIALVARDPTLLDSVKAEILQDVPEARVLAFAADVKDTSRVKEVVETTIQTFGRLDILIANAGAVRPFHKPFASLDPEGWWNTVEVNLRGVYNFVHFAIPHIQEANGYVVAVSSAAAQIRGIGASDYCLSKHALGRFIEFIPLEYPGVRAFSLHPGACDTTLGHDARSGIPMVDSLALPAATSLYLTSGKADWLSGRYLSATWDMGEVEKRWKAKVLDNNGLHLWQLTR